MQEIKETNTEKFILQCAEELFLERGFEGTKTTEIAKRAGVNHAMIHYYFRTKQHLFDVVFKKKVELFSNSLANTMRKDLPLFEKLEQAMADHFDFLAANPSLPFFIYSEIVNDDSRKWFFINAVLDNIKETIQQLDIALEEEYAKKTIRSIKATDLLMNMVALNVFTFLTYPLLKILNSDDDLQKVVNDRKRNNIEFILNSIKMERAQPKYTQTTLDFGF